MRLTEHLEEDSVFTLGMPKAHSCYIKLSKLEDIEDELGIDLLTLFKALKNGIWTKTWDCKYPLALNREDYTNHTTKYYVFEGKKKIIKLKDYGKTWALTKEELE